MTDDDIRIAEVIRAAADAVWAPPRLHRALAAQRPRRMTARRVAGVLTVTVAAALIALLTLDRPSVDSPAPAIAPPTIAETAAIALREPALPAPARDGDTPTLLQESSGGVRFPYYGQGGLGWRADGLLRTRRGGRSIVVVSYARRGLGRAGYAIVDGAPLRAADPAPAVVRGGTHYYVRRAAGATVVSWRRGGRTCVLASRRAPVEALLRMAAWQPAAGSTGPH